MTCATNTSASNPRCVQSTGERCRCHAGTSARHNRSILTLEPVSAASIARFLKFAFSFATSEVLDSAKAEPSAGMGEHEVDELAAAIALSLNGAPAAEPPARGEHWQPHEHYEHGPPPLRRPSEGGSHASLMAKHLTQDVYDELKDVRTAAGFSVDDVSRPSQRSTPRVSRVLCVVCAGSFSMSVARI